MHSYYFWKSQIRRGFLKNRRAGRWEEISSTLPGHTEEVCMAILAECPACHRKQGLRNKKCKKCSENLDKAKKSGSLRYYIRYKLEKKQRMEFVGTSFDEARAAEGKRLGQKKEGRIFDMLPDAKLTFAEIAEWYLNLSTVQQLVSLPRIKIALNNFNAVFGQRIAGSILPVDLEEFQKQRTKDGLAPATIDVELNIVRGMISKAFDNDKLDGRTIKSFRRVKNLSRRGENARNRTVTVEEYLRLLDTAPQHFKPMLIIAMNTGMRPGELRRLSWEHVDRKAGFIRLPAAFTKERREKLIPINHHVKTALDGQVRHLRHDYVFTFGGEPIIGLKSCKGALEGACRRAGIAYGRKESGGITMHDFRRTVKTNMLAAGVDKTYRDLILGHSLEGMDRHYIKPSEETLRQAMARYTAWLDDQTAKSDQKGDHEAVANL
jgi:integrase